MEVKGLLLDPASETPVLLLHAVEGRVVLPIWIGQVEANAIAMALEGIREPRPMTHDLMKSILVELTVELVRVEVWALREGTFYGRLRLRRGGEEFQVDARPSDAIALSVRTGASIWVAREVVDEALELDLATAGEEDERLREWLEKARPEDLGKYTM
ncbi:MAG: bifunctional nuclease family protein [Thermoanaerobaculia bacterium]